MTVMVPTKLQQLFVQLFVQQFVQANNKENIKAVYN